MANKRYDEFSAGTPSGSRLILHADPSTGDLEKATIAELPFAPVGVLFAKSHYVNANNSGSNPQTISTISIPANTITAQGQWLEWNAYFEYITGAGTKTTDIRIDGVAVTNINTTAAFNLWFFMRGVYNGSNQLLMAVQARAGNTNILSTAWGNIAFTPTAQRDLNIVITAGAANNIKMYYQTALIGNI